MVKMDFEDGGKKISLESLFDQVTIGDSKAYNQIKESIKENPELANDPKVREEAQKYLKNLINSVYSFRVQRSQEMMGLFGFSVEDGVADAVIEGFKYAMVSGRRDINLEIIDAMKIKIPQTCVDEIIAENPTAIERKIDLCISSARISRDGSKEFKKVRQLAEIFNLSVEDVRKIAMKTCAHAVLAQNKSTEKGVQEACVSIINEYDLNVEEILDKDYLRGVKKERSEEIRKNNIEIAEHNLRLQKEAKELFRKSVTKEVAKIMKMPPESRVMVARAYMKSAIEAQKQLVQMMGRFFDTLSVDAFYEKLKMSPEEADFRKAVAIELVTKEYLSALRNEETLKEFFDTVDKVDKIQNEDPEDGMLQ